MFNQQEAQFILNAIDQEVRRTGLQNAAAALVIASKLQAAFPAQPPAPAPAEDTKPPAPAEKKAPTTKTKKRPMPTK